MMSLTSSVFIFYLCICSLHASNARRLGLTDNGGFGKQLLFPSKVIDEVKVVNMDSTKKGTEFGDGIDHKSHGGEKPKPKAMKFIAEEEKAEAISGNKIEESSSHMGLPRATGVEDPRWQSSRRVILLEHDPHGKQEQQQEETHSSYHNSGNEVVQEADYDAPRMNIPTHN